MLLGEKPTSIKPIVSPIENSKEGGDAQEAEAVPVN
jgi:hypothetical protein